MGDTLKREFSLEPVDTGRVNPSTPATYDPQTLQQTSPGQPGAPVVRPSFLQAFLANLGPALAGGLHAEPGQPFGSGLGGALTGLEEKRRYNQNLAIQQQTQQRLQQAQASAQAYQAAETQRLQQLTPLDVQEKQFELQQRQGLIALANNPDELDKLIAPMLSSLGPLDPNEQSMINSRKGQVIANLRQGKFDLSPLATGTEKIAQDRIGITKEAETSGYKDYLANPNIDKGIKKDRATFIAWKAKQNPNVIISGNMLGSGNALDQQAELYAQTHELPPGLTRSPGTTAAIINRAAQLHPEMNLAQNQATFKADQASLQSLQKNFDQVTAFENTAIKNLDQVAKAGAKVPDLGTRFANTPVRAISDKVLGTPQMAAFRTALLTAQNESAKVLTSANATGVLSDAARKEAQDVLSGNLPFPAMMASINQLKTDFGNRHQSYQDQIRTIKGRLAGGKPSSSSGNRVIDLTK